MTAYHSPQGLIAMIRRVHSRRGRRRAGLYSIEGIRLAERALRAGVPIEAALIAQRLAGSKEPRHRDLFQTLVNNGYPITIIPDEEMDELTEGRDLGPIIGLIRLPKPASLSDFFPRTSESTHAPSFDPAPRIFLAAVDIMDPGNVGALTRTAHAAGAAALLAVGASDPYHPRATRISRGSIFKIPVIQHETVVEFLDDIRNHPLVCIGTAATGGSALTEFAWPAQNTVILMGNEAEGLPDKVQTALDYNLTIPMPPGVDSYSVNAAAAILLYAATQACNN